MIFWLVVGVSHLLGLAAAVHAIWNARTPQGGIVWVISLAVVPYLALPAYLLFGRARYLRYLAERRRNDQRAERVTGDPGRLLETRGTAPVHAASGVALLETLPETQLTGGNAVRLLIDGEATFEAIFEAIQGAERYVLVQFYVIRDDQLGQALKDRLIRKARDGVRVLVLYDEIGSHDLAGSYAEELRAAGAAVSAFGSPRNRLHRFQLNYRNHRKSVVVDGRVAFIGGHNVGDEYMGRDSRYGHWRDTHLRIEGPAAIDVQAAFLKDWYWATGELPELCWTPSASPGDSTDVLVVPTSPADRFRTAQLFFTGAINSARQRLWIATPYFVPDEAVVAALRLAAFRGVDVRILIPERTDHHLFYLSSFSYTEMLEPYGIEFFRYGPGMMHQKVMLIDDDAAMIGTANLNNRSLRLDFEISALVLGRDFATEVERMLRTDLKNSRPAKTGELKEKPFWFRLSVRAVRLLDPVK
ncbi:MAG: cardiolipin synthase [Gemmatimonadetes bacterium]|uniref:Cardiolipin synthase n=1 Tax=Candidatus Kutchimonas denitrificans TaxID=3056748 RepID=A0AAE4ZAJ7_9BACT|nr:cardiolipin synthase [Gemmatimonadota bacterium]NIR74561.1 cardiolipin synthase [Candidatus Kutchimonas denitrificans]NIS02751.1 cardiolipin synthase [Gemmatimonadota bacterium]NIT68912.1 cardiolipin synthase [Gemmatimonadota bacterium]NIU52217.1 cardiolipin synthase [Gemmatimonadota bacterium]